ncbi:class I SAM-dependent methyltransferase [Alkalitalea saponilacus]|uniref:Methyltransferase domain-containing protein n=1 Tax=Alkalitalea saponilacus TaxID=889453 RepID=A0A1T5HUE4_9BACT|nr:class I SAM-dependent methyltransferase [Alkalitalea saponilacus]ASB50362.1 SAM-dependent methyltransferase [Alkalitalea saponilacus]SKC24285.1 Methyltransferase domain-containing protein [Alkalitalea saponilacus]
MTTEVRQNDTIETFNKTSKRYQEKFMTMDLYNDTFDKYCNLIEKSNAEIFEIGTGPGNITRYLNTKRPDFKIFGIDLAPNMIELAKINNPSADFKIMDCKEIGTIERKFDGVMCGFCAPFLSKVELKSLINDTSGLLVQSGMLYLSTMEDDYNKSGFETTSFSGNDRVYIYYHQSDYLVECLNESGFEIVDIERKDYPESDGTFLTDMIVIAKKK